MKNSSLFLVALLIWNVAIFADPTSAALERPQAQSQTEPQTAKVESEVRERGTGERSRVRVTRKSGAQVSGYISKIDEASFVVTDKKTGQSTEIAYGDVRQIGRAGLSKGSKVATVVVVGVAVAAIIFGAIAYKVTHN